MRAPLDLNRGPAFHNSSNLATQAGSTHSAPVWPIDSLLNQVLRRPVMNPHLQPRIDPDILRLMLMSKRIFQVFGAIVLVLAALTPLVECFDHWDKNVVPANDTELRATALAVCVGFALTAARLFRLIPVPGVSRSWSKPVLETKRAIARPEAKCVGPTSSPPLVVLRI